MQNIKEWQQRLDWAIVVSLCASIFSLPISIALFESLSSLAILFFLIKKILSIQGELRSLRAPSRYLRVAIITRGLIPSSFLNRQIFIFIFVILLSVICSQYPNLSIKAFVGKTLQGVFLYLAIIESLSNVKRLNIFLIIYISAVALISIDGLFQHCIGFDFIRETQMSGGRINACLRHANSLGAFLILGSTLIFAYLNAVKMRLTHRFIVVVLFLLSAAAMGLTYSRAAWLGYFLALIICGFFQKRLIVSFVVILIFYFTFNPLLNQVRNASLIMDDLNQIKTAELSKKMNMGELFLEHCGGSGRLGFWHDASMMIKDYPILGVGLNNYSKMISQYKTSWGGYPHNSYLQMTAELGFLGLFAFFAMIVVLFRESFRNLKNIEKPFLKAFLAGLVAGLFGFLFESSLDTTLYSVQLANLMWITIGLILAVQITANKLKDC